MDAGDNADLRSENGSDAHSELDLPALDDEADNDVEMEM